MPDLPVESHVRDALAFVLLYENRHDIDKILTRNMSNCEWPHEVAPRARMSTLEILHRLRPPSVTTQGMKPIGATPRPRKRFRYQEDCEDLKWVRRGKSARVQIEERLERGVPIVPARRFTGAPRVGKLPLMDSTEGSFFPPIID